MSGPALNEMFDLITEWELSRTLIKSDPIFEQRCREVASTLEGVEILVTEYMPRDVYFFRLNARQVVTSPEWYTRLKDFVDAFADAVEVESVN